MTVERLNCRVKLSTRKAYGFSILEAVEAGLDHARGRLPEPKLAHEFCGRDLTCSLEFRLEVVGSSLAGAVRVPDFRGSADMFAGWSCASHAPGGVIGAASRGASLPANATIRRRQGSPSEPERKRWDRQSEPERKRWGSRSEPEGKRWGRKPEPERERWDSQSEPERQGRHSGPRPGVGTTGRPTKGVKPCFDSEVESRPVGHWDGSF
jgi:hypothetical protein